MKNTKLIIVSGISGSGKSSISKNISKQLGLNGIKNLWLHEEVNNHPIREFEFGIGSTYSIDDMDKNVIDMYERWRNLVRKIINSENIYVMEGCLYQNIIRYFFDCNYPKDKIIEYYDTIMNILEPLNPTIVFLYKKDLKQSFQEAFKVRGERWKNIILSPDYKGYFSTHPYVNDDSIYSMWDEYQELAKEVFNRYNGYKMMLDTSLGLWEQSMKELTNYLGINYIIEKSNERNINYVQYCGKYSVSIDGREFIIEIKTDEKNLFCQTWFWSNMLLLPMDNDEFDFLSFPIKLKFENIDRKKTMKVLGTYDWPLTGKTLIEF